MSNKPATLNVSLRKVAGEEAVETAIDFEVGDQGEEGSLLNLLSATVYHLTKNAAKEAGSEMTQNDLLTVAGEIFATSVAIMLYRA